jgi:hypothetical protein
MEERDLRLLLTGSRACQLRRGGVNLLGGRTRTTYDAVRSRIEGGGGAARSRANFKHQKGSVSPSSGNDICLHFFISSGCRWISSCP